MKKLLLLFLSLCCFFYSCNIVEIDSVVPFSPTVEYDGIIISPENQSKTAYIERVLSVRVNLNNSASIDLPENYTIKAVNRLDNPEQMFFKNTQKAIVFKEPISYRSITENDFLVFELTPSKEGKYLYELEISNGFKIELISVEFTGTKPVYDIDFSGLPISDKDSVEIERPKDFVLSVTDPSKIKSTKAATGKAQVSYVFKKGKGSITYKNRTTKHIVSKSGQEILAESPAELTDVEVGENQLMLDVLTFGENEIELTFTNELGFTQTEIIRVKAKKPEFDVAAKGISQKALTGAKYRVAVDVDNKEHPTNKQFTLTYKIVNDAPLAKSLSVDGELQPEAITLTRSVTVESGGAIRDTLDVPLNEIGEQTVYVFATDKFSTPRDAKISVDPTPSQLTVTGGGSFTGSVNDLIPFKLSMSNPENGLKHSVKFKIDKNDCVGGVFIGSNPIPESIDITPGAEYSFGFLPTAAGQGDVIASVSSYFSDGTLYDSKEIKFSFIVSYNSINATLSGIAEGTTYPMDNPISLSMLINEKGYKGEFKAKYQRINGQGKLSTPTIPEIKHDASVDVKTDIPLNLNYLPTSEGEHELHFIVSDANGQETTCKVKFRVTDSPVIFTKSDIPVVTTNQTATWTMTVSKENYTGASFETVFTQTKGDGEFKMGTSRLTTNQTFSISKNVPLVFSYKPTKAGLHILTLNVKNGSKVTPHELIFNVPVKVGINVEPVGTATTEGAGNIEYDKEHIIIAKPIEGYEIEGIYEVGTTTVKVSNTEQYTFRTLSDVNYLVKAELRNYEVKLVATPVEGGTVSGGGIYKYKDKLSLIATPATGWEIEGYYDEKSTNLGNVSPLAFTVPALDKTITVKFQKKKATHTITADNPTYGTVSGGGTYSYGDNVVLTATAATNYMCTGIYEGANQVSTSNGFSFTSGESNRSFTARFAPAKHTVNTTVSGSGTGTVSGSGEYMHNTDAKLTATASLGSKFKNFIVDGATQSSNPLTIKVTKDITVTAVFEKELYAFSATATSGGNITSSITNGNHEYGKAFNLTATPSNSHTFTRWTKNGVLYSTNANVGGTISEGNNNYNAEFAVKRFTITVNNGYGGGTFDYGASTTLTPVLGTDYVFERWLDGTNQQVSMSSSYTITNITSDATYTAVTKYNAINLRIALIHSNRVGITRDGATPTSNISITYSFEFKNTMNNNWESSSATVTMPSGSASMEDEPWSNSEIRNPRITSASGGGYKINF